MNGIVRKQNGFVLLESLGAICVLTIALGSLTLLLTVSANVKRQCLNQVQMRLLLTTHLEALHMEIGGSPECSLLLDDIREDRFLERTYWFSRKIRPPAWDGAAPAPMLLQLTIAVIPENGTEVHHDDVSALYPCSQGGP